ncbi:MAG: serine/threonine-protein kinase [Verrucomicrobiota bacterium]
MKNPIKLEEEIFEAALELTGKGEREAFLDSTCAQDPALRAKMEELLSGHIQAEKFFTECISTLKCSATGCGSLDNEESPPPAALPDSSPDEELGTCIGHYKILAKIGEGGCGTVYRAEQEEPVRRHVALKVIKPGMDTHAVIARFEAERQALAMMDHPNIARVFDAGATDTGRPYFVMELVHGVRITDYCDKHHVDTPGRLDLFIQICHAIQHAHQKGIIHRDIKPSNILVTLQDGVAVPKVIDFGIAKATTGQRLTDMTVFTACEQFIGTPAYMSPEQAQGSGMDINTRSDIYSLGVLLYELLTGKTPFDAQELIKSGVEGMRRTLLEKEPHRPSARLTALKAEELTMMALRRRAEPPKLQSLLRGDLDWIVMKALEKERSRRFETANGLAMDIQRHLNNEPVLSRPPSGIYRFQKLVRRNKIVFAAVAAVTAALLIGLGTSTWLFLGERQARHRAVEAEEQQARLAHEAETARANEAELRRQAEAREKITQASLRLHDGDFESADKLTEELTLRQPSMECASVFRALGEWRALHHQWNKAARPYAVLWQVDQFDPWETTSFDLLVVAPTLVEAGDYKDYESFRQTSVRRYADTTNAMVAERVVKVSLLVPPSEQLLQALRPLASFADRSFSVATNDSDAEWKASWAFISLALMEYRCGAWSKSADYCRRSLAWPAANPARDATAQVILSMACCQMGQSAEAGTSLDKGREAIENEFANGLDPGDGSRGFWFDWVFARILLREATVLMQGQAAKA